MMPWRTWLTSVVRTALGRPGPEPENLPFALVKLDYRNGTTAPVGTKRRSGDRDTALPGPHPEDQAPGPRWVEAGQVRFEEPPEGTLQLLPGRLEIRSGEGRGREIRFVRLPGKEPEVTFGRGPGPAYRHIRLESPTVSRLHARLRFQGGGWSLRNESTTNPTVVNGSAMNGTGGFRRLGDGDRIEMGEVVFLFRHPESPVQASLGNSWYTNRGLRDANQDFVTVRTFEDGRELAVVCDGMGADPASGLAGEIALETLAAEVEGGATLQDAIRAANRAVWSRAVEGLESTGMGTTLLALLREKDHYRVANVGDSRAYRVDRDGVEQLTEDHSFVADAVRGGGMTLEEARRSPWRNAVTRHLGVEDDVEADIFGPFPVGEPHLVVLCSDGVHTVLSSERLEAVVREASDIGTMARAIGEEALRAGSTDNVAAVVMEFRGGLD